MLKISFVGCEGAGKTFTTQFFANLYQVPWSIEYGAWYCKNKLTSYYDENKNFNTTKDDFRNIIQEQNKNFYQTIEEAVKLKAPLCFFDTDLIFTKYFIEKQFQNWNEIDQFIKDSPIDFFIFLNSREIAYKSDAIINPENKNEEIFILLKMYQNLVGNRLIVIDNDNRDTLFMKIQKILMDLLPDVKHPPINF